MKNLKFKIGLVSLILMTTFALNAQNYNRGNCQNNGQGRQQSQYNKGERICSYLDLSDDQKEKVDALRLNHQKEMLPLRNELNEKKAQLKTLETVEKADMSAINKLIDDMGMLKTKIAKLHASHRQDVRSVLTEEQRLMFDTRQGRKGRGNGDGCGNGRGRHRGGNNRN